MSFWKQSMSLLLLIISIMVQKLEAMTCNTHLVACDHLLKNTSICKEGDVPTMLHYFNQEPNLDFFSQIFPTATRTSQTPNLPKIRTFTSGQSCVQVKLVTNSEITVKTVLTLVSKSRRVGIMDINTENPSVLQNFSLLVGKKPNFESVLTLLDQGKEIQTVSKDARTHESWSTLDAGWTFSPPGIMGIMGRVFGMSPDIMTVVTKHLGLRIKYHYRPNYSAMSWSLVNRTTDLSAGMVGFNYPEYTKGLEVSIPFCIASVYFRTAMPGPIDDFFTLKYPFTNHVWTALGLIIFLFVAYFHIYNTISGHRVSGFHTMCVMMSGLLYEPIPDHYMSARMKRFSAYLILFTWSLLASLVCQSYRSTLLANLVAVKYEDNIDTFEQLFESSVGMMIPNDPVIHYLMSTSVNPNVRNVYQEIVEKNAFFTRMPPPDDVYQLLDERKIALLTTPLYIKQYLGRYHMSEEYLPPFSYGGHNAMIKHPWMNDLEATYGKMLDSGVIQAIMNKHYFAMEKNAREYERNKELPPEKKIELGQILAANIMMGTLLLVALMSFIVENCWGRKGRKFWKK